MKQPPSGQPPRNPLRAALERFGRERGQHQPRDCPCLHEGHACVGSNCEDCLRFNHQVWVLEQGRSQPQSSAAWPSDTTAASADEVERRRRADSTAIEQSQPQPSQWQRDEQESRDALARGEGITFENAEQAIKWLQEPEQGQPQQEPAVGNEEHPIHPDYGPCDGFSPGGNCSMCIEVLDQYRNERYSLLEQLHGRQERQAGVHVHERGEKHPERGYNADVYGCKDQDCHFAAAELYWNGWEARGEAAAAAEAKER